jgi:hypothetical protein
MSETINHIAKVGFSLACKHNMLTIVNMAVGRVERLQLISLNT